MKAMIKKWLDIKEPKEPKEISDDQIASVVMDCLDAMFKKSPTTIHWGLGFSRFEWQRGEIDKRLREMYKEKVSSEAMKQVSDIIDPESFIDSVVCRIKSKQVN